MSGSNDMPSTITYKLKLEQAKRNKQNGLDAFDSFLINATKVGLFAMFALFLAAPKVKPIVTQVNTISRFKP